MEKHQMSTNRDKSKQFDYDDFGLVRCDPKQVTIIDLANSDSEVESMHKHKDQQVTSQVKMASNVEAPRDKWCGIVVGDNYRIKTKIGSGSFGGVFVGVNLDEEEEVAVKIERKSANHPQLVYENEIYQILKGGIGIPNIRWYGEDMDSNFLVMDLLGPSLEVVFNECSRKFSLKTVLLLADQAIARIEYVHTRDFIHRDLKPDNFVMGVGRNSHQVYLIDFGLAKRYRDCVTHRHIPYREDHGFVGTLTFASETAHSGGELSRRDDLLSLGYMLIYLLRGGLPWEEIQASTRKEANEKYEEMKMWTIAAELCKGYPPEFEQYIHYCRSLRFEQTPNYSHLRKLFQNLFESREYKCDYLFDWVYLGY